LPHTNFSAVTLAVRQSNETSAFAPIGSREQINRKK
jgi:hypothetical protein